LEWMRVVWVLGSVLLLGAFVVTANEKWKTFIRV